MEKMTAEEYRNSFKPGNKFNARRTNGRDSKKENSRFQELRILEEAGEISDLEEKRSFILQIPFEDNFGRKHRGIKYTPDFYYHDNKKKCWVAEDTKGGKATKTEAFRIRFKWAQRKYPEIKFVTT